MIPLFPVTHADDSINLKTSVKLNFSINPAVPSKSRHGTEQQPAQVCLGPRERKGTQMQEERDMEKAWAAQGLFQLLCRNGRKDGIGTRLKTAG